MVSHEYRCIFIHIPKCAGTSIENALGHLNDHVGRGGQDHRSIRMFEMPLFSPYVFSSRDNMSEAVRRIKHKYLAVKNPRNKLTVTKEQFDSYFKFAFVRNPWSRAFSWYTNVMQDEAHLQRLNLTRHVSFNEFVRQQSGKGELKPQMFWLKSFDGSIPLNFIGRFENLAEDFQKICEVLRLDPIALPHRGKGSNQDYRDHYDEESKRIIEEVYREEISAFGYSFDG
ncbi:MAG: sulfotransferase family 2 domain-containing protein [Chloroflexota bacterium]